MHRLTRKAFALSLILLVSQLFGCSLSATQNISTPTTESSHITQEDSDNDTDVYGITATLMDSQKRLVKNSSSLSRGKYTLTCANEYKSKALVLPIVLVDGIIVSHFEQQKFNGFEKKNYEIDLSNAYGHLDSSQINFIILFSPADITLNENTDFKLVGCTQLSYSTNGIPTDASLAQAPLVVEPVDDTSHNDDCVLFESTSTFTNKYNALLDAGSIHAFFKTSNHEGLYVGIIIGDGKVIHTEFFNIQQDVTYRYALPDEAQKCEEISMVLLPLPSSDYDEIYSSVYRIKH